MQGRILVIDDEEGIRRGIQRVLAPEGHEVAMAADGTEGVAAIQAAEWDLLLVDLKMPGPLDGLDVIREALAKDPDVIAIVISAYATLDAAVQATRLGAYDFLAKPFTPDDLRIRVRKGLERRFLVRERKRLEEERERSLLELSSERSRLRSVVNSMADGVVVINQGGTIVYANPMAAEMLRVERELVGRDYLAALESTHVCEQLGTLLKGETPDLDRINQEFDVDEGTTLMANLALVRDEGRTSGCVLVLRDISRLKELDRSKSRFVSVVSHELKAPLAAVEGYLDVLLTGAAGEVPEKVRGILDRCRERSAALQALIKDILNITRIEAQTITRHIERLQVSGIIDGVLELLKSNADPRGITLVHEAPADLPRISADKDDFERILTNLVSNAIKYNRDGGKVRVHYAIEGGTLAISVSDSGIGIDSENLELLGKEFYRVRSAATSRIPGTGLGLSIIKRLMEFYGGRLAVQSVLGEGSTFTVIFPLEPEAATQAG